MGADYPVRYLDLMDDGGLRKILVEYSHLEISPGGSKSAVLYVINESSS